jgi:pyruvate dehydrogenase E2 component (dihydrolipoamide acetyltransferase)
MAKEFILPDLGEGIHEAQVVKLLVKQGDAVGEDQMVMEVETDKAAVELPVPFAGTILSLNVDVGQTVKVGQVLLTVDDGSGPAGSAAASAKVPIASAPAVEKVEEPALVRAAVTAEEESSMPAQPLQHPVGPVPAAPAVRRLARELGLDLRQVHGTGPGGRIVREDVERHQLTRSAPKAAPAAHKVPSPAAPAAKRGAAPPPAPPVTKAAAAPSAPVQITAEALPDFTQWGPVRREQIPQIRKTIARQMARAWAIIPHVTHADDADVTDLETFRKQQGQVFAEQGAKLTLTAFVVKAVAGALQQHPKLNASYDEASSEIVFKDYVNVGIAVDTPRGLMVPVLRNADRKSLLTISKELKDLADRAREFKLDISEMRGGTFTITNVGALGGTFSTPMINWPEVAILGMGKIAAKPIVRGSEIVPRLVLPLFLSFDHRVIDGADGARFTKAIITFLENPLNLLLVS